jgi:DNA polymerase-3 subunit chi
VVRVDFYHLTALPLDRVLPRIAERLVTDGERLLIVADDGAMLDRIDELLWTYAADSFLPHGRTGAGQPVLLAGDCDAANGARNVALIDGRWRDEALGFKRAFHLFDEATVGPAREAWRSLAGREGVERRYWKQDEAGRWAQAG